MENRISIAVIGVGNMGRHHARVYSQLGDVDLVAIADVDERTGRTIARKYHCTYYKDYLALLARENVDAVTIAVPTSLHKEVAISCIEQRIPLLIEKPIAESIRSARAIIREAERRQTKVCVGHIERFNPVVQHLKTMIKRGRFGKIIVINTKRVGLYPPQVTDTDVVIDLAVHDIDVCNFLLDKGPINVYARAGGAFDSAKFDYADIFLNYGAIDVIIQVNWITPVKVRELTLTGTKAYAELSYLNQTLNVYKRGHGKDVDIVNIEDIQLRKVEPLENELKCFIKYVQGDERGMVSAQEGLLSLAVASAAIASHQRGKAIKVIGT
jgi:UDP-N-acetylglucosamine 3-dehydrogenase